MLEGKAVNFLFLIVFLYEFRNILEPDQLVVVNTSVRHAIVSTHVSMRIECPDEHIGLI